MYRIYARINKVNKKPYIGRTRLTLEGRAGPNGIKYLKRDKNGEYKHPKFANAINKYGWENFETVLLEETTNFEESKLLEHNYILKYNAVENGYNCNYGESNRTSEYFSKETLEKMSKAKKGKENKNYIYLLQYAENRRLFPDKYPKLELTEEYRKQMSLAKLGDKNPMYGKTPYNKGKKRSPETLEKMKKSAKYGADNSLSKAVIAIKKDTGEIAYEFGSVCEAARFFKHANETAIISCLKGRTKSSAGYYWRYKDQKN